MVKKEPRNYWDKKVGGVVFGTGYKLVEEKPYTIVGEFNSLDKVMLTPKGVEKYKKKGFSVFDWKG